MRTDDNLTQHFLYIYINWSCVSLEYEFLVVFSFPQNKLIFENDDMHPALLFRSLFVNHQISHLKFPTHLRFYML